MRLYSTLADGGEAGEHNVITASAGGVSAGGVSAGSPHKKGQAPALEQCLAPELEQCLAAVLLAAAYLVCT